MRIAIHQPHYFPWLGYLDKMTKVDKFVLLDDVQLTDKSNMFRNKLLSKSGEDKYMTICFTKKGYMDKPYREVELNSSINWQKDQINFIVDNYKKSYYFNEIWEYVYPLFEKKYLHLCDVAIDSLVLLKDIFEIPTEIVLQSKLNYDIQSKKNDLVLNICQTMNSNQYLSGNGARKYMDLDSFTQENIQVAYQEFKHPIYTQCSSPNFITNLSALDLLFNCGIEKSREIFWCNVKSTNEFKDDGD
jgi:hypothetical protein